MIVSKIGPAIRQMSCFRGAECLGQLVLYNAAIKTVSIHGARMSL